MRAAAAIAPATTAAHDIAGLSSAGVEISTASKTIDVPFWKRNHRFLEGKRERRARPFFTSGALGHYGASTKKMGNLLKYSIYRLLS